MIFLIGFQTKRTLFKKLRIASFAGSMQIYFQGDDLRNSIFILHRFQVASCIHP